MSRALRANKAIPMYHLYLLHCHDNTLYAGITTDLHRRIKEHNDSALGAKYTRSRRPVKLVYSQVFANRALATIAEAKLKKLTRAQKLALIAKNVV